MELKKFLLLLMVAVPVALAGVYGILWYQHLPLKTAMFYREAGDLPTALASVEQYLEAYPHDEFALAMKAQLLCHSNRFHDSIAIYQQIGPASAEDLLCFTKALVATQQWQLAANTSQTFEDRHGDHPDNYLWAIISLSQVGNLERALEKSRRLAMMEGQESQGLLLYGELKVKQNDMDEAVRAYQKALELNPEAKELHIEPEVFFESYADLLLGLGKSREAVEVIDRGLQVRETPRLRHARGLALLNLGQTDEAKNEWLLANRVGVHVDSHLELAKQLLQEGDPQRAARVLELLRNIDHIDSRYAFLMQSICDALEEDERSEQWKGIYERMRRHETVEGIMHRVIMEQPYNEWSLVFRAYFNAKNERWQEAADLLRPIEQNFLDEEAYLVLRQAITSRKIGPEVMIALEKKGIGVSQ